MLLLNPKVKRRQILLQVATLRLQTSALMHFDDDPAVLGSQMFIKR
jgi:hypothetical protein